MDNRKISVTAKDRTCQAILLFMALTAHQVAAAGPGQDFVMENGKIVNSRTGQPISSMTGTVSRGQAPDIAGRIDAHAGLADVYAELVKTSGYFAQGSRQNAARDDAERVLREHMEKTGDSYGFVRVQSDKAPNPALTPGDEGFLLNYKAGTPGSADSPYSAAAKLKLTPDSERPTMSADSPDRTPTYPSLAFVLSAERGTDGKVTIRYADRDQLLKLSKDFMTQQAFKTGREYDEAQRRSKRAEALHAAKPTPQTKREAEETKAREDAAKVDYERQREARAQRLELEAAKQSACSGGSGEGCSKAKDDQLQWYEKADKTGKTGMVRPDELGSDPGSVPNDTPPFGKLPEKAPEYVCLTCEFGRAGDRNLAAQLKVAQELSTPSSKFAQDYLRQMRKPGALLPRR